jgi:hypothetical protein
LLITFGLKVFLHDSFWLILSKQIKMDNITEQLIIVVKRQDKQLDEYQKTLNEVVEILKEKDKIIKLLKNNLEATEKLLTLERLSMHKFSLN